MVPNQLGREFLSVVAVIVLSAAFASTAHAAPGGNGGGKPGDGGGDSGSTPCTDDFPSFTYTKSAKRGTGHELFVSSREGCRIEKLADIVARRGSAFSYNNGHGLVAWAEGDNYDLWILKFGIDENGSLLIESQPHLVLPTQQPNGADPSIEYFFGVDVWADYSDPNNPVEIVSLYSLLNLGTGSGNVRSIKVLDLGSCPANCTAKTLISASSSGALACQSPGSGPFDPFALDADLETCLVFGGTPAFDPAGSYIYYLANTLGPDEERWYGTFRLTKPTDIGGWLSSSTPTRQMIVMGQNYDCVPEAMPAGGRVASLNIGSETKDILVASTCVGFDKGITDRRLYFLDVQACIDGLTPGFRHCEVLALSGEVKSASAGWLDKGEVLYDGFSAKTLDTIRIFNPSAVPTDDDRQIISKGNNSDSGM